MDATHLTPERREKLRARLGAVAGELAKVEAAMRAEGWYTNDPALCAVQAAVQSTRAAMGAVRMAERLPAPERPKPPVPFVMPVPVQFTRPPDEPRR